MTNNNLNNKNADPNLNTDPKQNIKTSFFKDFFARNKIDKTKFTLINAISMYFLIHMHVSKFIGQRTTIANINILKLITKDPNNIEKNVAKIEMNEFINCLDELLNFRFTKVIKKILIHFEESIDQILTTHPNFNKQKIFFNVHLVMSNILSSLAEKTGHDEILCINTLAKHDTKDVIFNTFIMFRKCILSEMIESSVDSYNKVISDKILNAEKQESPKQEEQEEIKNITREDAQINHSAHQLGRQSAHHTGPRPDEQINQTVDKHNQINQTADKDDQINNIARKHNQINHLTQHAGPRSDYQINQTADKHDQINHSAHQSAYQLGRQSAHHTSPRPDYQINNIARKHDQINQTAGKHEQIKHLAHQLGRQSAQHRGPRLDYQINQTADKHDQINHSPHHTGHRPDEQINNIARKHNQIKNITTDHDENRKKNILRRKEKSFKKAWQQHLKNEEIKQKKQLIIEKALSVRQKAHEQYQLMRSRDSIKAAFKAKLYPLGKTTYSFKKIKIELTRLKQIQNEIKQARNRLKQVNLEIKKAEIKKLVCNRDLVIGHFNLTIRQNNTGSFLKPKFIKSKFCGIITIIYYIACLEKTAHNFILLNRKKHVNIQNFIISMLMHVVPIKFFIPEEVPISWLRVGNQE